MNIENFKPIPVSFDGMFKKQLELKFAFEPSDRIIYEQFDIDSLDDQEFFKKICWRITEELMEALEDRSNPEHFREELIDGFNFLLDLYNLYGWDYSRLKRDEVRLPLGPVREYVLDVVYQLGITANCLKNRQWRHSQYMVDILVFEKRFELVWEKYMALFAKIGMTEEDIQNLWSLKYQVNKFRIETKY